MCTSRRYLDDTMVLETEWVTPLLTLKALTYQPTGGIVAAKLQIMYALDGTRRPPEAQLPWLAGYEKSSPVRMDNAASDQLQLDVWGGRRSTSSRWLATRGWDATMMPGTSRWR